MIIEKSDIEYAAIELRGRPCKESLRWLRRKPRTVEELVAENASWAIWYLRRANDTLWAEYERQCDALRAEYERQCDALWAEYKRQCDPLLVRALEQAIEERRLK